MRLKLSTFASIGLPTIILLIGVILLIRNSSVKHQHHLHYLMDAPEDETLKYGLTFPDLRGYDLAGRPIRLRDRLQGRWTYLIQTTGLQTLNLDYPKILLKRYNNKGLQFIYLYPSKSGALSLSMDTTPNLSAIWLPDLKYPKALWTTLVDQSGVIKFSLPHSINNESLPELQAKNAHYKGALKRSGANRPKTKVEMIFPLKKSDCVFCDVVSKMLTT
jgi:hypothetical protein